MDKKMNVKFVVWVLLVVILCVVALSSVASADKPYTHPVEVEVRYNKLIYSYACFPYDGTEEDPHLLVYLIRPDGIAMYICDNNGLAWVLPRLPRGENQLASY